MDDRHLAWENHQKIVAVPRNNQLFVTRTREALLSEAGFERFSGSRIRSVGGSCFVDDFVSCWGQ